MYGEPPQTLFIAIPGWPSRGELSFRDCMPKLLKIRPNRRLDLPYPLSIEFHLSSTPPEATTYLRTSLFASSVASWSRTLERDVIALLLVMSNAAQALRNCVAFCLSRAIYRRGQEIRDDFLIHGDVWWQLEPRHEMSGCWEHSPPLRTSTYL